MYSDSPLVSTRLTGDYHPGMKQKYPSDTADKFMVRMVPGLRDRIEQAAKNAGRSMNAEIVRRLEESFARESEVLPHGLPERINAQIAELDQMFERLEGRVARVKGAVLKADSRRK